MNKELIMKLGEKYGDPYRHLYFEKDIGDGGVGLFNHPKGFVWLRENSNKNIEEHGFSFYLALNIHQGYTVFYMDHNPRLSSGWVAWRKHGYLFENKEAGAIEYFQDGENEDYLENIYIEMATEISDGFRLKYDDPCINEWTSLYGIYNWGENKVRLRKIKEETGKKFSGWCFQDYPGSEYSMSGFFSMHADYSIVKFLGGGSISKDSVDKYGHDIFDKYHEKDSKEFLKYWLKDDYGKIPVGRVYLRDKKIIISTGCNCPDSVIPLVIKEFNLDRFIECVWVEHLSYWEV